MRHTQRSRPLGHEAGPPREEPMQQRPFHLPLCGLVVCALVLTAAAFPAAAQEPACGGEGSRACTISPAALVGREPSDCPEGRVLDLTDGGTCWGCPPDHTRQVTHVESADASARLVALVYHRARQHQRGRGLLLTDCPRGQFWNASDGYCWSCPQGFHRTLFPITDARACAREVRGSLPGTLPPGGSQTLSSTPGGAAQPVSPYAIVGAPRRVQ